MITYLLAVSIINTCTVCLLLLSTIIDDYYIGFIALSDVRIESGPTYLYEGTHTKQFHNSLHLRRDKQSTYYSSDGSMENAMSIDDQSINMIDPYINDGGKVEENSEDNVAKTDTNNNDSKTNYHQEIGSSSSTVSQHVHQQQYLPSHHHHHHHQPPSTFNSLVPIHFHLQIGDILLFNSMIFHYGAANTSIESRPLLSFSFQNLNSISKQLDYIDGFTYHRHHTIRNAHLTIVDFPFVNNY